MPEIAKRIADLGNTLVGSPPEEFGKFLRAEHAKWGKYAKVAGRNAAVVDALRGPFSVHIARRRARGRRRPIISATK